MTPRKNIAIVCTLDTKGVHALFMRDIVERRGHRALLVDTGLRGIAQVTADVTREQVAAAAGMDLNELATSRDRAEALGTMAKGASALVVELHRRGKLQGILGIGGGSGTAVASAVMRALPFGVPKVMVSTMAGGDVARYVGTRDIAMLPSITDIMGLNPILRRILCNAAGAIAGMVEVEDASPEDRETASRPTIAITAFGVTTRAALRCQELLEAAGYGTMIFHANGTGGRAMEELVQQGAIDAVIDLTTTELADELCGGKLSAGPHRLEAAGARGIPQVVLPGAMDMVNFGPPETVPTKYADRLLHRHSTGTTLMRTTPEESTILGRWVGEKLGRATGPTILVLPLRGFSEYDREGGVFDDPEAGRAFREAAVRALEDRCPVVELDANANDLTCAEKAVELLLQLMRRAGPSAPPRSRASPR